MRLLFAVMMTFLLGLVGSVSAQSAQVASAKAARDVSLQMSRYEQMFNKLEQKVERSQSDIRVLQRDNDKLQKELDATRAEVSNSKDNAPLPWGEGQRDCTELGVKHQQLKVTVKPDGTRGVRFLCFDGKALHLGSESYVITP